MSMRTLEENIARLEKANEETRAVVRGAHEAIKTAKLLLKELRAEHVHWSKSVRDVVDEALSAQVDMGLAAFKDDLQTATTAAQQAVLQEFDELANVMMYGNKRGRGENLVEEWVRKAIRQELNR